MMTHDEARIALAEAKQAYLARISAAKERHARTIQKILETIRQDKIAEIRKSFS